MANCDKIRPNKLLGTINWEMVRPPVYHSELYKISSFSILPIIILLFIPLC